MAEAEFDPDAFIAAQKQAVTPEVQPSETDENGFNPDEFIKESKYGTGVQQAITGVEGLAQGVAGPLATLAETKLLNIPEEDIRARQEVNPVTHGVGSAVGFGGSALLGTGEAAAITKVGEFAGAGAAKLGLTGGSTISRIALGGIKTGAEMAALQAGDEVSKAILKDPGQTLGTAAINIGLSGVLGFAGGAGLGGVHEFTKKAIKESGADKIINDAKAQYEFRQSLPNGGDVPQTITNELNTRLKETANMRQQMMDLKGESLSRVMPKATPENISKTSTQAYSLVDKTQKIIDSMGDDPLSKRLQQRLNQFKSEIEHGESIISKEMPVLVTPNEEIISKSQIKYPNPKSQSTAYSRLERELVASGEAGRQADIENLKRINSSGIDVYGIGQKYQPATPQQIFDATNKFKNQLQEWAKFNKAIPPPISERGFISSMGSLSHDFKSALENPEVWGEAGIIQTKVNKAISDSIPAIKEARGQFANKEMNEYVANPAKIQTLVDQSLKGKAGLKTNWLNNYIKKTEALADTINNIHRDAGLEAPIIMTPTPALNRTLGNSSHGTKLGNWLFDKGLANLAGHAGGQSIGAGIGALVGHPIVGGVIGEKLLAPVLTSMAKPLLENATRSEAVRGSVDYIMNALQGQKILSTAVTNMFKSGSEIVSNNLKPDQKSREKLDAALDHLNQNPEKIIETGGNVGHYLPDHATAAAAAASSAVKYLNSLKPKQPATGPLDAIPPVRKMDAEKYNRALDIAQQPLMILEHVKKGTLLAEDVKTLQIIYPNLHSKMVSELSNRLIDAKSKGVKIPYYQRVAMTQFMGSPIDSTMTPQSMQTIIRVNGSAQAPQSQGPSGGSRKAGTQVALNQINKMNKLYLTSSESRQIRNRT